MGLDSIAPQVVRATPTTQRTDLPPLVAYDAVSIWSKTDVDEKTGEVTSQVLQSLSHPIGKTGAGLNAAIDRILASFEKRGNKGYNDLDGFEFVVLGVTPAQR